MTGRAARAATCAALAFALGAALPSPAPAQSAIGGQAVVDDGDTLVINGAKIRLWGIDAPERDQACLRPNRRQWNCGAEATAALDRLIGGARVECRQVDMDRYRRPVALCYHNGVEINRWMVAQGWAVAYRRFTEAYVPEEDEARAARRGIWNGRFDMPWDWRR